MPRWRIVGLALGPELSGVEDGSILRDWRGIDGEEERRVGREGKASREDSCFSVSIWRRNISTMLVRNWQYRSGIEA